MSWRGSCTIDTLIMQVTWLFLVFLVGTQARGDGGTETEEAVNGLTALTSQLNISLPNPEPRNKGCSLRTTKRLWQPIPLLVNTLITGRNWDCCQRKLTSCLQSVLEIYGLRNWQWWCRSPELHHLVLAWSVFIARLQMLLTLVCCSRLSESSCLELQDERQKTQCPG